MSDSKSLAQKIRERQKLVERIVGFVEKIVLRGERTQYSQGSFNTHTVWELKNLAGFSFKGDFGQTMMGGNDVYVWYKDYLVFHAYFQGFPLENDCEVRIFKQGSWLTAFKKFTQNRKKVLAQFKKRKERRLQRTKNELKREKSEWLQEEAKRLKLRNV